MDRLIYTAAFGEKHYKQFAQALVRSAREAGYDGHFAVLLDNDPVAALVIANEGCTVVDCSDIKPPKVARPKKIVLGKLARYYLSAVWNVERYNAVTYLDADCLFTGHKPPDLLFDHSTNMFNVEPWVVIGNDEYAWSSSVAMPAGLKRRVAHRQTVNSGAFTVFTRDFGRFCDGVRTFFKQSPNESDQACVNAYLYSHEDVFPWNFFPSETVSAAVQTDVRSTVKHYEGRSVELGEAIHRRYPEIRPWWVEEGVSHAG